MVKYYIQMRGAFEILYFINFQINNTKHFTSYIGPIYKICRGSVFFKVGIIIHTILYDFSSTTCNSHLQAGNHL